MVEASASNFAVFLSFLILAVVMWLVMVMMTIYILNTRRKRKGGLRAFYDNVLVLMALDAAVIIRTVSGFFKLFDYVAVAYALGSTAATLSFFAFALIALQWYTLLDNIRTGRTDRITPPRGLLLFVVVVAVGFGIFHAILFAMMLTSVGADSRSLINKVCANHGGSHDAH